MTIYPVAKPAPREPKPRKPLPRPTKPLPRSRTPIAKVGRGKPKRVKRYRAHLASKFWKTVRYLVWQRDGGVCRDCGRELLSIREMHAAHVTNARCGNEHLDDVKCSCADCNMTERSSRAWAVGALLFPKADPSIGMELVT